MDQMMLFEQNRDDITIAYTDGRLQVTLNFKMDRHLEIVFQRMVRRIYGVQDCQPDRTVNKYSENTAFLVTFADRPGTLANLPAIQEGIKELARRHVEFTGNLPTQGSLF